MTLSPKDFNSLPKTNIEQLIKLSSVVMYKVKNYGFYRTSLFWKFNICFVFFYAIIVILRGQITVVFYIFTILIVLD